MSSVRFVEAEIDGIFQAVNHCAVPGAAVGIGISGKPVYRKGFGLANLELPVVLSPAIRMPIGSTTKHFTCLAYLLLCEAGKARLDDRIGEHMPELHPVMHGISMRQLMGHTGGLRDPMAINTLLAGVDAQPSAAQVLQLFRQIDDLNDEPEESWIYNNGGYIILGSVIERVSGRPLAEVLREQIFEPVGMYDTLLPAFGNDFLVNSVAKHRAKASGGFENAFRMFETAGAGGVYSTVNDMLRWLAHMDNPLVGNRATWAAMTQSQRLRNGTFTGYGLGLHLGTYRGIDVIYHSGGVNGGNSQMLKVPGVGLDIVVMCNRDDVNASVLANTILDSCLEDLDPTAVSEARGLSGIFFSPKSGRVIELYVQGMRQFAAVDGFGFPVVQIGNVLRPTPERAYHKVQFVLGDDSDSPGSLVFDEFGNMEQLIALTPTPQTDASRIIGTYRSTSTSSEIVIGERDGTLAMTTHGPAGSSVYRLQRLGEEVWRATSTACPALRAMLEFAPENNSFRLNAARVLGLTYSRTDV